MRLPHHPEQIATLRTPTDDAPWRVLVSGCIVGLPCGVDGSDYGMARAQPEWFADPKVQLMSFCPEDVGLGTPRSMPDLHGGDGFAVLDDAAGVRDEHGQDLTQGMLFGAHAMVDFAAAHQVDFAVLTDRSGACGSQVVSLGCRFESPVEYIQGVGVATAALLRAGVHVVSHRDYRTLGLLGEKVDPKYAAASDAIDHHESQWVQDNLT